MPIMKSCTRPFLAAVEPLHYRLFAPPQLRRDRECWYSLSTHDRLPAGFRDPELRHLDQLPINATRSRVTVTRSLWTRRESSPILKPCTPNIPSVHPFNPASAIIASARCCSAVRCVTCAVPQTFGDCRLGFVQRVGGAAVRRRARHVQEAASALAHPGTPWPSPSPRVRLAFG